MVVPVESPIRVLISAEDVLHSWAVPTLGVKIDAVPGRLNQTAFIIARSGVFYGQCSEICGANHSFMPIVVEAVPLNHFENWSSSMLEEVSLRSLYWGKRRPFKLKIGDSQPPLTAMPQLNPSP